jgi:hypothetical protein
MTCWMPVWRAAPGGRGLDDVDDLGRGGGDQVGRRIGRECRRCESHGRDGGKAEGEATTSEQRQRSLLRKH